MKILNKIILFLVLTIIFSCQKSDFENNSELLRKPDPMNGGNQQVVIMPQTDFNISWDTTWNCSQTLLNWNNKGSNKYYILFQGNGNGSCPNTFIVNGITYYYPWLNSTTNTRALLSGQICGTVPLNNYNIIIRYYTFSSGKWNEYNSLPVNIPLGTNICN